MFCCPRREYKSYSEYKKTTTVSDIDSSSERYERVSLRTPTPKREDVSDDLNSSDGLSTYSSSYTNSPTINPLILKR